MAKVYRRYQPSQTYIVPMDIREWLPENHLALFVSDVIDDIDLSEIFEYYERSDRGYPPYHPVLMVKILTYGYCIGVRSSRRIHRALYEDVAFRVLGAGNFPDFRTISDFRKIHLTRLEGLFQQVLKMCARAGLVKLGTVAIDGTKIKANAGMDKNRNHRWLTEEEERLRKLVREMLEDAERIDQEEDRIYGSDNPGFGMPDGFRTRKERLERIRKAKKQLEDEQRKKYKDFRKNEKSRDEQETESGKKMRGRKPDAVSEVPDDDTKRNTTDADSRIMKTRTSYIQGYNAQLAVDAESMVIVANAVTQDCNDRNQLVPMLERVQAVLGRLPECCTTDAGYWNEKEIRKMNDIVELYVATMKDHRQRAVLREFPPPRGRIPASMSFRNRMERKLRTVRGRAIYKKRSSSVEPVNGHIKEARGIRRFLLRGLEKVTGEFSLISTTHNILKLWKNAGKTAAVTG